MKEIVIVSAARTPFGNLAAHLKISKQRIWAALLLKKH